MLAEAVTASELGSPRGAKLRQRDYILIPLISLATVFCLLVSAEIATRIVWPATRGIGTCISADPLSGYITKANCTDRLKNPESPWVTYHYNECGFRTYASCGAKPPGTIRIALLGSSVSQGLYIPFDQTFIQQAAHELSRATGHPVEVQNLGLSDILPLHSYRRLTAALAVHPDLVVYAVTPVDLEKDMDPKQVAERDNPQVAFAKVAAPLTPRQQLQAAILTSRALVVAEHFLFSNTQTYLRLFLRYGDKADYLRVPTTPHWQSRYANLSLIISDMARRTTQQRIPLLVMAVPSEAEGALLHEEPLPAHTDPLAFGRAVQDMTVKAGAEYVDGLGEFARVPQSEHMFYVVNAHVNSDGQALIARALVDQLLKSRLPLFRPLAAKSATE